MSKKLIMANIFAFLVFLVMFILQWFVLKNENAYFVLIFLCVLSLAGIIFIVLSIISIVLYIKELNKTLKDMQNSFVNKNDTFNKK